MNVFLADDAERRDARRVFGRAVASVTFWDAEDSADGFELITAYDATGAEIGRVDPSSGRRWARLADVPSFRCQSVKFGLSVE